MVRLTPGAASALRQLMAEEAAAGHGLRLQIVGGGCEGLYYDLDLVPGPAEGDEVGSSEGIPVFVDGRARELLGELTLDYQDGFRFENPRARATCRCGASFR
ncbi:MAG: HesB/IscA family protein [Myxococcales bacterium]